MDVISKQRVSSMSNFLNRFTVAESRPLDPATLPILTVALRSLPIVPWGLLVSRSPVLTEDIWYLLTKRSPGIEYLDWKILNIAFVAGNEDQAVNDGGCCEKRVDDRSRPLG